MNLHRSILVVLSLSTAAAALAAAYYWLRSSRPTPDAVEDIAASISDNPELHILDAHVGLENLRQVLMEASRLNKMASIWSGVAAALAAIAAIASAF